MDGILIPQKVFIGDTAEFLYPLDNVVNDKTDIKNIRVENIIQNSQMTITNIEIKKQDDRDFISLTFIPWDTGDISFPSLVNLGLDQDLPNITISSILQSTKIEILQPPRPPMLIPGTTNLIYIAVGVFMTCLFFIFFVITAIKTHCYSNSFSRIQKKRVKIFYKKLKKLQKKYKSKLFNKNSQEEKIFIANWLKEFEIVFKDYCISIIKSTLKPNNNLKLSNSPTYSEILINLKNEFSNSVDIYLEFKDVFFKLQKSRFRQTIDYKIIPDTTFLHFINKSFYISKISEEQILQNNTKGEKNYDKI